jgi:glutaredoxin-dependent peroxiredoxin
MSLNIGDKAPDFKLYSSEKEEISLGQFAGENILILFFPQAFTGVCTTELCSIRDNMSFYNRIKAQVLAISVDSIFTLDRFKKDQNLNFPLLSDFNKEVSQHYGAFYDTFVFNMKGVSKRSAFVVDKNGTIQYAEVLESAGDLPNFEKITKTLESL